MDVPRITLHIKNMAGGIIDIEDILITATVLQLKGMIAKKLNIPSESKDGIELTKLDDSSGKFTILTGNKTLNDYGINNNNNELNLIINMVTLSSQIVNTHLTKYLDDVNDLEILPPNTQVVKILTPDMVNKTLYIVSPKNDKKALQCSLYSVGEKQHVARHGTAQIVQIGVVKKYAILRFDIHSTNPFAGALKAERVYLLEDSDAAQGGRRRKRSRKTKRTLCRRRRTHRKQ